MAIDCTPSELADQAKCYTCLTPDQRDAIKTYLLAVVAGLDGNTPQQLLELAKCYTCIPEKLQKSVQNYLLCQIVNSF